MKLRELSERLGCRLEGDGDVEIVRVAGIEHAQTGDLTFLANSKYESALAATRASAVLLRDEAPAAPCAMLRTPDPYLAFARAVGLFAPEWRPAAGVHPMAAVAQDARIGRNVSIGAFVSVGEGAAIGDNTVVFPNVTIGPGVRIGSDCVIHSNVALRERVTIGNRVILQNGVVVGGDGYGFVRRGDGTHEKIPQVATVVIEDDVELGANTAIDRPAVGETRIGSGTKIDNLVMIAHNVRLGRHNMICSQVGVAGSTTTGDWVVMAGQVGVRDHVHIGDKAVLGARSGVSCDIEAGRTVLGEPAIDLRDRKLQLATITKLPEMRKELKSLAARLESLERAHPTAPAADAA